MFRIQNIHLNLQSRSDDDLAEIFHENTKIYRSTWDNFGRRASTYVGSPLWTRQTSANYNAFSSSPELALPPASPCATSLDTALRMRASSRGGGATALAQSDLTALFRSGAASTRRVTPSNASDVAFRLRPYPSAGALYPIEIYGLALNVSGLSRSVLHYSPVNDRVSVLADHIDPPCVDEALRLSTQQISDTALVIVLTSVSQRSTVKYGSRGYRFALLEAGHISQNILLISASLGLSSLCWGGYIDDDLAHILTLDGLDEAVVAVILIGGSDARE